MAGVNRDAICVATWLTAWNALNSSELLIPKSDIAMTRIFVLGLLLREIYVIQDKAMTRNAESKCEKIKKKCEKANKLKIN